MSLSPKERARIKQAEFFGMVKVIQEHRYDSEIADAAGISRSLYSQMKGGHKPMSLNSMVSIARVLEMDIHLQFVSKRGRKKS